MWLLATFLPRSEDLIPGDTKEPRGNHQEITNLYTVICELVIKKIIKQKAEHSWNFNFWKRICDSVRNGISWALRYKPQMFGIPIEGPTNVWCDNKAVTKNALYPKSTLKKNHNAIAYHQTQEVVALGTTQVT